MKLGLDIGVNSIGFALIDESKTEKDEPKIISTGVRIVNEEPCRALVLIFILIPSDFVSQLLVFHILSKV